MKYYANFWRVSNLYTVIREDEEEANREKMGLNWNIIHRDSDISTQPRYMEEAGQVLSCAASLRQQRLMMMRRLVIMVNMLLLLLII